MKRYFVLAVLAAMAASSLSGCSMHMMPSASATLLASNVQGAKVVPVGSVVVEEDCFSRVLWVLGGFGNHSKSHERLITKILDQQKADVLVDADLSYTQFIIPFIYHSYCATVKGQPARLIAESEVKK
jgi:hypothetical protein